MTIEEIKSWRLQRFGLDGFEFKHKDIDSVDWLIAEVEKYQKLVAGNSQLQIDWVDVTAKRCAVIADNMEEYAYADEVGDAIRKEFNL